MTLRIRPYQPEDRAAIGRVCIATGDSGGDATGLFSDDELLPAIYAYPYLEHDPKMAWVIEDPETDAAVVGYILGTADIESMATFMSGAWAQKLETLFQDTADWTAADFGLLSQCHGLTDVVTKYSSDFQAEFHIDMLPPAQRRGLGRELIGIFADAVKERGGTGIVIGVGGYRPKRVA